MGSQPRVQKFSPILIKFSAFIELLIISILIKKISLKAFFFHRDILKILLVVKRQKWQFDQWFLIVFSRKTRSKLKSKDIF
jgi:hypothetical protein